MTTSALNLFQAAFMQSWNAIVITDADLASGCPVQIANPAFCAMTGYSEDELRGRTLKILQGPDTDPAVIENLRLCLKEARYFEGTTTNYRKDGSSYIVRWSISPVRDDEGVVTHFVSVQQDISDYVRAERDNRLLARALDATTDPVVMTDDQARIIFANSAFTDVTGYSLEELKGKTPALLRSGQHDDAFYAKLRASLTSGTDFRATFINRRRDGSLYHAEQSISPIPDRDGRITHYVSVSKDISERVDMEQALRHAATRDTLTGLYNRRHGDHLLDMGYRKTLANGTDLSLFVCDIDHFKRVNDRFGHPAGDRVLGAVARILQQAVRASDAVIRWGGEEFVILLDDCPQAPAIELGQRIRTRVSAHHDAEVGQITLSLGLATREAGETMDRLIARADAALYEAKRAGRNRLTVAAPA
jgi:diguanylate cyclase (GGDEF)-like protein/PAS domain S-box-containing protein